MLRSCAQPFSGMPKKTKKEKVIAQQRRAHLPLVVKSHSGYSTPSSIPNSTPITLSLSSETARLNKIKTNTSNEYNYVNRDIIKTILLTSIILISEYLLTKWLPL